MDENPYRSPQEIGYEPPPTVIMRRPAWSFWQHVEGWLATGFMAALVFPMVVYLQHLVAQSGVSRAIWWWITLPSIGLVAVVAWLAARCLRQLAYTATLRG